MRLSQERLDENTYQQRNKSFKRSPVCRNLPGRRPVNAKALSFRSALRLGIPPPYILNLVLWEAPLTAKVTDRKFLPQTMTHLTSQEGAASSKPALIKVCNRKKKTNFFKPISFDCPSSVTHCTLTTSTCPFVHNVYYPPDYLDFNLSVS